MIRVRLIGDFWDFNNKEDADKFIEDDKGSGYEYITSPITEQEILAVLEMTQKHMLKPDLTQSDADNLALRIMSYSQALAELQKESE